MHTATTQGVIHIPAGAGETLSVIGEQVTLKIVQADTNDTFTVAEMVAQPGGGPPPHTHPSAEIFVILEGEFIFMRMVDGKRESFRATPGDTVYVPAGAVHTYRAVGDIPGKTLFVLLPGGDLEGFFREVGTPLGGEPPGPPTPEGLAALISIAHKHGMEFLPPEEA